MKKILKRVLVTVLVLALAGGGVGAALMYTKKNSQKEVMVIPVESLYTQVYSNGSNTLDGTVTTSISQNVNLDQDSIVQEIYVKPGDRVKQGDKLISFDMTLQEMEQNINQLTLQNYKNNLIKAQKRLTSLQNGGPIEENTDRTNDYSTYDYNDYGGSDLGDDAMDNMGEIRGSLEKEKGMGTGGMLLAAASHLPVFAAFGDEAVMEIFQDDGVVDIPDEPVQPTQTPDITTAPMPTDIPDITSPPEPTSGPEPTQGPDDPAVTVVPDLTPDPEPSVTPSETPAPTVSVTPEASGTPKPSGTPSPGLFEDGMVTLYKVLDEKSEPYKGTGTQEDPYIFLCSAQEEMVIAKGSFINLMAGYDKDGKKVIHKGGYWYRLEFYDDDDLLTYEGDPTVEDDLKYLCLGYYLNDGGLVEKPMRVQDEMIYTLENSTIPDLEEPGDDWTDWGGGSDTTPTMTRAEAIKQQQKTIAGLKLDIRKKSLEISKLEKKLKKQTVISTVDGVVKSVGDPATGDYEGNAFMVIDSDQGYYIKGNVSEMYLDQFKEGTLINGYSYESGVSFQAEVRDVADYPVSEDSYYYGGYGSNSNASYYEFMAYVTDQSLELQSDQWISLTFQTTQTSSSNALNLMKAFVRTQDGQSFVYKEENGVLKKQIVTAGASKDGGYSVPVTSGVSMTDKLAFPYGSNVKEGAKTREGTFDELYEYGGLY